MGGVVTIDQFYFAALTAQQTFTSQMILGMKACTLYSSYLVDSSYPWNIVSLNKCLKAMELKVWQVPSGVNLRCSRLQTSDVYSVSIQPIPINVELQAEKPF